MDECTGCQKPTPRHYCWESRWDCPCGVLPRYADPVGAIQILTWLLAELTWKFNEHRHDTSNGHGTNWGPIMPHWK